jgi:Protein of unknown function (DUF2510)
VSGASPGWYDDGSGRQRYWDGAGWGSFAESVALEPAAAAPEPAPSQHAAGNGPYVYHTELLSVTEKWIGRTGSGSHEAAAPIAQRLTELSAQGWEFVTTTRVPVVGKVFKAEDVRTLTVAIFRRPAP